MPEYEDGELTEDRHGRWCKSCNQTHGPLYPCKYYPKSVLEEIESKNLKHIANLRSRAWCDKQKERTGIDDMGIEIFRAMAGIAVNDWTD